MRELDEKIDDLVKGEASRFEKMSKRVEVGSICSPAGWGATTELRLAWFAVQVDLASEKSFPGKQKGLECLSHSAGRTDTLVLSTQKSIMTGYPMSRTKGRFITFGRGSFGK